MPTKKVENQEVSIPAISINTFQIKLVGDSPLIVHAWSEKAKRQMLEKQMKKAKTGKEAKDPWADYCDSMYWLTEKPNNPTESVIQNAKFGFPSVAFKSAAVTACSNIDGMTKVSARQAFHIVGDMVEIIGKPEIREDMVRIGMGTADIRYRGEFKNWSAIITVRQNVNALSIEQIVNLFNIAGFGVGIGEWRPEKDGSFGMFHVE